MPSVSVAGFSARHEPVADERRRDAGRTEHDHGRRQRPARGLAAVLVAARQEAGQRHEEQHDQHPCADQAERLRVRSRRRVEGVRERRERQNRRRERVSVAIIRARGELNVCVPLVAPPTRNAIPSTRTLFAMHRADERRLHDGDQPLAEREEGDEELRQVAERATARPRRPRSPAGRRAARSRRRRGARARRSRAQRPRRRARASHRRSGRPPRRRRTAPRCRARSGPGDSRSLSSSHDRRRAAGGDAPFPCARRGRDDGAGRRAVRTHGGIAGVAFARAHRSSASRSGRTRLPTSRSAGAGGWAASLLAGAQADVAQHFARSGIPPVALWNGVDVRDGSRGPLVAGALGWLECRTVAEHDAGDHTSSSARSSRPSSARRGQALVYRGGGYFPRDRRGRLRPRRRHHRQPRSSGTRSARASPANVAAAGASRRKRT